MVPWFNLKRTAFQPRLQSESFQKKKACVMQNKSEKLQHTAAAFRQIAKAPKAEKKTFHPQ